MRVNHTIIFRVTPFKMDEHHQRDHHHDLPESQKRVAGPRCNCLKSKRIALVTGSASGIGANIALDLVARDYFVIITGRNESKLKKLVEDCNKQRRESSLSSINRQPIEHDISDCVAANSATFFRADLTITEDLNELIRFVLINFERLDVLVNNACWRGNYKHLLECDAAYNDFKQVMHMNVSVPLHLTQRCLILPRTSRTDVACKSSDEHAPVVINISSIASQVVVPLHAYSISKACLSQLSKQVAQSARTHHLGVLSVTISPGPVLTEERPHHKTMSSLTLLHRVGTTQNISDLVLFAISNAHMFNGKELYIDGGYIAKQKLPLEKTNPPVGRLGES